ncbi:MAG: TetR/AcrR family transcriptional regulator [Acidimicrobiia bacterium]|nr:TetR/AcrR family transcriptional regulator [Acidimicrobiia bacterium]
MRSSEAEQSGVAAVAQDGRPLGRRGLETRRRFLDATEEMLRDTGVREIRVVDIARRVGTSPATFYQYFTNVEEAVLGVAAEAQADIPPIVELMEGDWAGDVGLVRARKVVDAFFDYWDRHHAVLRVRNLAAEEGDERFVDARMATLRPLTEAMCTRLQDAHDSGWISPEIQPYAAAAALVAMLERIGAYHHQLEHADLSRRDMVETTARILHQTVAGTAASTVD